MNKALRRESGSVMIAVLIAIMLVGGICASMLLRGLQGQRSTTSAIQASKLLFVAEAGLNYNYVQMAADPVYAVKNFVWNPSEENYSSPTLTLDTGSAITFQEFQYDVQYLNGGAPVEFTSLIEPSEPFDRIKVTCTASGPWATRVIASWYTLEATTIRGAIVSDMVPDGSKGNSKSLAKDGHIVFNGADRTDQQIVFGDISANGLVVFEDKKDGQVVLDDSNIGEYMAGSEGRIRQQLYGTMNEIPDFTNLGGANQLFDFDRFYAAAEAGAGQIFYTLDDFREAMANANSVGETLEGITVLNIDPSVEGNGPELDERDLPDGINITGTIFMNFADGTDLDYKLFIETPLNVNAADLSDWNELDESTYTSGYPGVYRDEYKMPSTADITPDHENFVEDDDLPAVIFNTGIVDIHGAANVCGVVYGPSFIEIENHGVNIQYFNGAIYGGGGVYFDGKGHPLAIQAIRFDPNTTDQLQTTGGMAQALLRTGYAVVK